MKHFISAALIASALLTGLAAGPAWAAEPANQACLGEDFSGYAQDLSPWGQVVRTLAEGGFGNEIQAHLAGLVPDSVIPNSCSD